MRFELRLSCVGLCALLLAPGCANQRSASRADGDWGDGEEESAGGQVTFTQADQADLDCAGQIREEQQRICNDAPPTLPESYASRSRATYEQLDERCGTGMRSRAALRELDDCIFEFEESPSQIDLATRSRREEARPRVAALKDDPLYPHARRKLNEAREEVVMAQGDYEQALRRGVESNARFKADAWEQAESELRAARGKLIELMGKYNVDPRDARSLGVW